MEVSKEYRIGNYILDYECEPYYFPIEEIKKNEQGNLAVYYRKGSCMSVDPEPIPLSEDILLKCGFIEKYLVQWNGNGADYQPEDVCTQQKDFIINSFIVRYETFTANGESSTDLFCGLIGDWYERITFDCLPKHELQYLHQLQNLIFSLTNTEINLKEIV